MTSEIQPPSPPAPVAKKQNSLDFIRLIFASLVIIAHSPDIIDGNPGRELFHRTFGNGTFGGFAVDGFFVLSGYLITQSWLRNPNLLVYFKKRILRIYPGFIVACLISAFVVGTIGYGSTSYLHGYHPVKFIKWMLRLQPEFIPSFPGTHYPVVNGPMWTIPYEFTCYILVSLFGIIGIFRSRLTPILPLLALGLISLYIFPQTFLLANLMNRTLYFMELIPREFYRMSAYFLAGMTFYFYQKPLLRYQKFAPICLALLLICLFNRVTQDYALLTLGTFVLFVYGLRTYSWIEKLPYHEDYSYGVYLYGWPIQKLTLLYFPAIQPFVLTVIALPLSFCAGALSWKLVEKPCLKLK